MNDASVVDSSAAMHAFLYSGFYRNAGNNCLLWWALWSIPTNLIGKIAWFINAVDTIHNRHCKIASINIIEKIRKVIVKKTCY